MTDEQYMEMALNEARQAFDEDEVPVGAVVVCGDRVIASAHNATGMVALVQILPDERRIQFILCDFPVTSGIKFSVNAVLIQLCRLKRRLFMQGIIERLRIAGTPLPGITLHPSNNGLYHTKAVFPSWKV